MKWTEIKIKVQPETEELVSSILYDIGAKGISIEDSRDIDNIEQEPGDWDYIDLDKVSLDFEGIYISVYFSEEDKPMDKLRMLEEEFKSNENIDEDEHIITTKEVREKDWAENWKRYYKPTRIGESIIIKPTWEDYEKQEGDIIVEIDPGMAFGTGTHETTSMCVSALEKYVEEGDLVYDVGTGSGILSIVAGKMGAREVIGTDLDANAVKVARENVKRSKVTHKIQVKQGDLFEVLEEKADVIVANIIAEIIVGMTDDVSQFLKKDGIFITSGIILDKVDDVKNAMIGNGFKLLEVNEMKEWACIIGRLK